MKRLFRHVNNTFGLCATSQQTQFCCPPGLQDPRASRELKLFPRNQSSGSYESMAVAISEHSLAAGWVQTLDGPSTPIKHAVFWDHRNGGQAQDIGVIGFRWIVLNSDFGFYGNGLGAKIRRGWESEANAIRSVNGVASQFAQTLVETVGMSDGQQEDGVNASVRYKYGFIFRSEGDDSTIAAVSLHDDGMVNQLPGCVVYRAVAIDANGNILAAAAPGKRTSPQESETMPVLLKALR